MVNPMSQETMMNEPKPNDHEDREDPEPVIYPAVLFPQSNNGKISINTIRKDMGVLFRVPQNVFKPGDVFLLGFILPVGPVQFPLNHTTPAEGVDNDVFISMGGYDSWIERSFFVIYSDNKGYSITARCKVIP
jgi:hypothetical protein